MKKVVLDTNFLIDLIKFKIDLEDIYTILNEPCRIITLNLILNELNKLAESRKKNSKNAKIALKLIKLKKIKVLNLKERNVDKALLNLEEFIIATNDKRLRKKLKSKGIKTIYLRTKKYLAIS